MSFCCIPHFCLGVFQPRIQLYQEVGILAVRRVWCCPSRAMPKGLTSARVTGRVTGLGGVIFHPPMGIHNSTPLFHYSVPTTGRSSKWVWQPNHAPRGTLWDFWLERIRPASAFNTNNLSFRQWTFPLTGEPLFTPLIPWEAHKWHMWSTWPSAQHLETLKWLITRG